MLLESQKDPVTAFLLAVLIAAPAAGALAVPARSLALLQGTVAAWLAASFAWLILTASGNLPEVVQLNLATLVEMDADGGAIALSIELSSVRVGLLVSGLLLLLPTALRRNSEHDSGPPEKITAVAIDPETNADSRRRRVSRSLRLQLGILPTGAIALLCDDLIVVVAAWLLLDSLLIRFAETTTSTHSAHGSDPAVTRPDRTDRRFLLTVLRLSSVALLVAVLLANTRYHSTSLTQVIAAALADTRIDASMVRSGTLVWFALAIASRAALFPIGIWMRPLVESNSRDVLPTAVWAAMLPAAGVLLSLSPLLPAAPESCLLLAVLAGLSGVTFGAIALTACPTNDEWQLLPILVIVAAISVMGVSVPALSESTTGSTTALIGTTIVLSNTVALGVLSLSGNRRTVRSLAAAFLLSGLGGPNYLLDQLHSVRQSLPATGQTNELTATTSTAMSSSVATGLWWALCVTQFLIGATVATYFLQGRFPVSAARKKDGPASNQLQNQTTTRDPQSTSAYTAPLMLVLAIVGCLALASTTTFGELISFNAATPSGLLGAVSVWLFLQVPVATQDRVRAGSASFKRLTRNWFYADEAVASVRLVAGWVCWAVEVFDRKVLGGRSEDAWRQNPNLAARGIEGIDEHGPGYASLAALLAVTGLLLALTGFGR